MLKFPSPVVRQFSIIVAVVFGLSGFLFGQKQNNIWYFGNKAGLDFNISPPAPLVSDLFTLEGTASISDPAGHLLFYTNGATVWDRNHNVMPNGSGLMGGMSSSQAALIVPLPNSCSQYYLFTTEDHLEDGGLTYSIVDMCLNDGLGDIVSSSKNTLVVDQTAEKITAVLHVNGVDIWIVTHTLQSDDFLAYLLSSTGLNTTPVISSIGSLYTFDGHIGPIKASHDGSKIVSSSSFHDICEMFDFNSATGELTNFYDINQLFDDERWVYGIEFSPNDRLLYLSTFFVTNYLYQIDLESKQLTTLNTISGNYHFGALQMGPDKKIYLARNNSSFLDVIHQPDLLGHACQYDEGGQLLSDGTTSQLGLPNFVPYSFFHSSNTILTLGNDTTLCNGESHTLEITIPANCEATSFLWNDGSSGSKIVVNQSGLYWIEVESTCSTFRDSIQIDFVACQPECGENNFARTLGTIFDNARGYSLAVSPIENVLYIGGVINDSVAIIKMNADDEIVWTRTFDIVPGLPDHLHRILVDSDGNIAVAGVAGPFNTLATVFAFRYDPINNVMLWVKHFKSYETDFNFGFEEIFPDGDFIMCNNPGIPSNDDAQVIKLNRITGEINPEFSKHYHLGASESLNEMIFHDNFLYASGRFTDGDDNEDMRNTLIKIHPVTGTPVWTILGHLPDNVIARLYGEGLVIDQDEIYSISTGDPDGTGINSTEIYVQKTSLDGDVIWMNRYDLPGNSDYVDEIIKSEDGFVIMARTRIPPNDIILFKVERDGNLLWARSYDFSEKDNANIRGGIQSPLRQFGDHLYFTAFSETNGSPNMVLVKTNLEGEIGDSCAISSPVSIEVIPIQNPFFYNVDPTVFSYSPETTTPDNNSGRLRNIQTEIVCIETEHIVYEVEATICEGEMYEGYEVSGTFVDTFKTSIGCDSVRTLHLTVNICQPECAPFNGPVYGSPEINEKGYSLVATPEGDGSYVAGIREDSILLLKVDLKGAVQWSRVFDLVKDSEEYPFSLIVDSEGMLALAGTTDEISIGGPVFVMRYDPYNHQVLWSNEYRSIDNAIPGAIIQKGNGGNYVLVNDLNDYDNNHIDVELLELNINTGAVLPSLSKKYRLSNRESLFEIVYDGHFIYGTGRYKADNSDFNFRNTLVKLNPDDGTQVWVKMGHFPNDMTVRLYGAHLLVDEDAIISGSYGDPSGTSVTNTNLYLQKTDLDGNVIWLKQYNISETNSFCYGIIRSGDGYIILSGKQQPASDLVMFKIDPDGTVLWAKTYQFSPIVDEAHINATLGARGQSKVIQVGNQLFFTGFGINALGGRDLLVVRTDLEGNVDMLCVKSQDFPLTAEEINNPVFFSVNPDESNSNPVVTATSPENIETLISPREVCSMPGTIFTSIEATICEGESFEGYIQSGIFPDTFLLSDGCDSIRTLHLTVNICQPECDESTFAKILGSAFGNERGYSLAFSTQDNVLYIGGGIDDKVAIIKMNTANEILWTRTFDIVPGKEDHLFSILVDSDGMIAVSGIAGSQLDGGTVFAFRYDPGANSIFWATELISTSDNYNLGIIELGPGGDYLMNNNPSAPNDAELVKLDRNTGAIIDEFSKHYDLGSSETMYDLEFYNGKVYAAARFTDGGSSAGMRNTLIKFDPVDGLVDWTKLGHITGTNDARLYGIDLAIAQNEIYSVYLGDTAGTSIDNTQIFIQKTSLNGDLLWIKQYELPGINDWVDEIIHSNNGLIILARNRVAPSDLILFKIEYNGNLRWAKKYDFSNNDNTIFPGTTHSQLIEADNHYFFTGFTEGLTSEDIILIRTNLRGEIDDTCSIVQPINIPSKDIDNPVFYSIVPDVFTFIPEEKILSGDPGNPIALEVKNICLLSGTIEIFIEASICLGESFEGYSQSGIFSDTFLLSNGCDSIRTLRLSVISCEALVHYDLDACRSYMDDGSHMDYSEFIPAYPTLLPCAQVSAGILHRDPSQKHSCTPGIAGSPAMCVTTLNSCTYVPGNEASVIIEVTINPSQDSIVMFTGFEFYEKSPGTFSWIDGDSGPNNYPRFYGIRILKNGSEIFRQINIATTTNWTLQSFDFISNDLFRVEENTVFRIELLPYCPVGNGALMSAWDIDEFKIFGGCIPVLENKPIIIGQVHTKTGKELSNIEMILADNPSFTSSVNSFTEHSGKYLFENLDENQNYFEQGYKNDDVLNGVSTLDIIHIQKHLLGKEPFTSLHQYIAADVNRSNHVSALDILDLRKLLLGIYSEFPRNTSWRFGPLPQDFTEVDPGMFEEIKILESLAHDTTIVNFVGIKIGDLNDDVEVDLNAPVIKERNSIGMTVRMKEQSVTSGIPFSIEFTADDYLLMTGMQFAMKFKNMEFVNVAQGKIPITQQHFSITEDGFFRLSWNQDDAVNVSVNDVLFTVTLKSDEPGLLSDKMEVLKIGLKAEVYAADDLEVLPLEFELQKEKRLETGYLHIEPNPVQNNANLRFYLVNSGQAIIRFYDASGKHLYSIEKEYLSGENLESVTIDKFHSTKGIIYCQLISTGFTSVQKFVIMN